MSRIMQYHEILLKKFNLKVLQMQIQRLSVCEKAGYKKAKRGIKIFGQGKFDFFFKPVA